MRGDIQDVKAEVVLQLQSPTFLAALAAVDAEKSVTTPTPGPTQVFRGEKAVKSDQGFPVAEVIGITTLYGVDDQQTKDAAHEIQVIWTQVGDDELLIADQLERLVRATRDLFWPQAGPIVLVNVNSGPLEFVREDYAALMPGRDHQFVKASATTLRVPTLTL